MEAEDVDVIVRLLPIDSIIREEHLLDRDAASRADADGHHAIGCNGVSGLRKTIAQPPARRGFSRHFVSRIARSVSDAAWSQSHGQLRTV